MGRAMRHPTPLPRSCTRLGRVLALLAWFALAAQAVGVPIHLAVEEHAGHGHHEPHDHHVHFGRFGHHDHHHHHQHHHPNDEPAAPFDAPCQRDDAPPLPPHSALDHLIDTIASRANATTLLAPFLATAPVDFAFPPPMERGELDRRPDRAAPEKPPPRRPEQSRAPPASR